MREFPTADRYLIGASGGRDSIMLLHALLAKGYRRLIVCHLNHQLRGRAAGADARFVSRLAEQYGLECEVAATDVRGFARQHRQSIETAARTARYAFFLEVARRRRCRTIFLAHHADDLVETFLFNLFRGAGGGRAMQSIARHLLGKTTLIVVRPLLHVWRTEIDAYIRTAALEFREDASNADLAHVRNRMRHKIIPALEREFGRSIRKTVWRAAMISAEEDALLETMLPRDLHSREQLRLEGLKPRPLALQRRAIRAWLRHHEVPDVGFDLIERVRSLADATAGPAKINLPGDRHARRRAGELFIEEASRKVHKGTQR